MSQTKPVAGPAGSLLFQPTLVVLGRDDTGKPHASWFHEADAKAAKTAAALMGMHALALANDELRALAAQLPSGRVFASGRAFVPFVKAQLFEALMAHLPAGTVVPAVRVIAGGKAKDGAANDAAALDQDAQAGSPDGKVGKGEGRKNETAKNETGKDRTGSRGAKGTKGTKGTKDVRAGTRTGNAAPSASEDNGSAGDGEGGHGPADGEGEGDEVIAGSWPEITVGSLVLATEGPMEGWYEAVVEAAQDGEIFLMRWRDWPDEPHFSRHRNQLGLLPSGRLV